MAEQLTHEKWQRAKQIFEAALGQPQERRSAFVVEACAGDAQLISEVETLLVSVARADGGFQEGLTAPSLVPEPRPAQLIFQEHQLISRRFEVLRFIGRGGMGEVYEARDLDLGERVALKTIRSEVAADLHIMARFKREIQLARKVTHPNVCRIFDLVYHEAIIFLSMELLEGETLSQRLQRDGPMSASEALPLVAQMAAGLAAAHQAGVVHGDFKSNNVMLVPAEGQEAGIRTVIMDFGLARRSDASDAAASRPPVGSMAGTPAYMAPEQVEGREITPATDIYALGVVLYEMVTGRCPFEGSNALAVAVKRLQEPPPSPRSHNPGLDLRWEQAILRCLERNPRERFASADEIIPALRAAVPARVPGEQPRVLEAAAPKYAAVKRSMQLLAMIRQGESQGLKSFLEIEEITSLTNEDIRTKPFRLEFPVDRKGDLHEAEIALRVDSPDFEPKSQIKKLMVPPERDTEVCTFLLTPQVEGELLLNLEVLKGEVLVTSRAIKTVAKRTEQPQPLGPNVLVSIPLEVFAYGLRAAAGASLGQGQWPPAAPVPPSSALTEWGAPRGALPSEPATAAVQFPSPPPSSPPAVPSAEGPGEFTSPKREKKTLRGLSIVLGTAFVLFVILGTSVVSRLSLRHKLLKSSAVPAAPSPSGQQLRPPPESAPPPPAAPPDLASMRYYAAPEPLVTLLAEAPHGSGGKPGRNASPVAHSSQPIAPNAWPMREGQVIPYGKVDGGLKPINLRMTRLPGARAGDDVIFTISIDAGGNASPVRCLVDDHGLCQRAMAAAAAWKFSPPKVKGKPASTSISVKVTF